ncbi:Uncharacterized protein MBO1_00550 [Mycobacterium tuberculosis variant bovis]|nr:Conserved exported protein of unknown function [Mycobacterium canettii CIPT 140070008]CEJ32601.1 Uncharacterized protein MBO_503162 [Mycobacterium tuberculosis variant bovis]CEJ34477.1 Uncharacterized protein MBO1_00550 [Mycobacterium tuberculosis variant bovis]CEJ40177.1 Uncharacterized protein MBO_302420 [Mycobacterium tuberculosis variant bovis]SIP64515.1 conserved hypothetical protein [Mycobacterium tuberculosis]
MALRRRVKKSAIGSVIVIERYSSSSLALCIVVSAVIERYSSSSLAAPSPLRVWGYPHCIVVSAVICSSPRVPLPAALLHAGQLTRVRHLAQANPAQPELAVDRTRAAALAATGVGAHGKPRFACGLVDQCLLRHLLSSP